MSDSASDTRSDTLAHITATAVHVPIQPPIETSAATIDLAPLVLVDVETRSGRVGCSYVFCYTAAAGDAVTHLVEGFAGQLTGAPLAPLDNAAALDRLSRLIGREGLVGMAISAIEMALWDAVAKAAALPLVQLLGAAPRAHPVYACLRSADPTRIADEAGVALHAGYRAVKIRVGHPVAGRDEDATRAAISAFRSFSSSASHEQRGAPRPVDHRLMVDYNQALAPLGPKEAARRLRPVIEAAGDHLEWIEEPLGAFDDDGHAELRGLIGVPIQLGENAWGPESIARSFRAGAGSLAMFDVMKIGGVGGWLRASALADSFRRPVSSHLFPEISAHLQSVCGSAHWLEGLDVARPILRSGVRIDDGFITPSDEPGIGVTWDRDAVRSLMAYSSPWVRRPPR